MDTDSTLPDALLRQLIAVGQVDVLVGLPTLNNAATITDVVRAVHVSFTRIDRRHAGSDWRSQVH